MEQRLLRTPHNFLYFLVGPLVSASAGATPPLYGIVCEVLGWNSRVQRGYEVDIYLFWSPPPLCFVALFSLFFGAMAPIWRLPDVMGSTSCATSLSNYCFYF